MVTAIEKSTNRKIGNVSATYVAQQSCPDTCKLKGNGCYAENDFVGFTTRRLNKLADGKSLLDMAHAEAKAILTLKGDKHLRNPIGTRGKMKTITLKLIFWRGQWTVLSRNQAVKMMLAKAAES